MFNIPTAFRFASRVPLMKRTRAASKAHSVEKSGNGFNADEVGTKGTDEKTLHNRKLSAVKNTEYSNQEKNKINLQVLKDRNKMVKEEFQPNVPPPKNKPRAVVDLKMMTEELKHLEDPPVTEWEKEICSNRLPYSFYDRPCEELAQNLLGKILVRCLENGTILKGRIVETEGYLGTVDKASHTYQNKVTPRNIPMYMPPGTIYVYMTYGMYHCFNISSQGEGCAVLIRAVEPLEGTEYMASQRTAKGSSNAPKKLSKALKTHELCNGPSKLCMAFQLQKNHSKYTLCSWKGLWIENDRSEPTEEIAIVKCPRIGIDNREEWTDKPLRYYILGNMAVSKRNKEVERRLAQK
ncbi:DNA-3-methyladenine glycosylase-like isoform X2 [Ceratina calcarata]|uniref:DNA-3-methyladenine glycosylase n=1 Tax=Ceratina calcarata TaxID=156304 RepID=A0AAJ7J5W7_9HYME|nr:DNA-3-methyladenine glycosylase-like isoform X2 [Ceratina calcarata]